MDYNKLLELRKEVSLRIEKLLLSNEFDLSIDYLKFIHKYLFDNILPESGNFRTYNVTKKEEILNGDSVIYPDYHNIEEYLKYDITSEKAINYYKLSTDKQIKNIADFTSRIWLNHPFIEGNTRTTSVFIEKYLNTLGYHVNNDIFKNNSLYFRNSLVKANYYNYKYHIHNDLLPLIIFFKKVLLDHNIILSDELLYVPELFEIESKKRILTK